MPCIRARNSDLLLSYACSILTPDTFIPHPYTVTTLLSFHHCSSHQELGFELDTRTTNTWSRLETFKTLIRPTARVICDFLGTHPRIWWSDPIWGIVKIHLECRWGPKMKILNPDSRYSCNNGCLISCQHLSNHCSCSLTLFKGFHLRCSQSV